jgi:hypothetical protein
MADGPIGEPELGELVLQNQPTLLLGQTVGNNLTFIHEPMVRDPNPDWKIPVVPFSGWILLP